MFCKLFIINFFYLGLWTVAEALSLTKDSKCKLQRTFIRHGMEIWTCDPANVERTLNHCVKQWRSWSFSTRYSVCKDSLSPPYICSHLLCLGWLNFLCQARYCSHTSSEIYFLLFRLKDILVTKDLVSRVSTIFIILLVLVFFSYTYLLMLQFRWPRLFKNYSCRPKNTLRKMNNEDNGRRESSLDLSSVV